eukprot:gene33890-43772_t
MAAANIEGITLDSIFAGLSICENVSKCEAEIRKQLKSNPNNERWRQIRECGMLTIDEISTLRTTKLRIMDRLFRIVRGRPNEFMGGVRTLLCGDFMQLDAVGDCDEKLYTSTLMIEGKFRVVLLDQNMRQNQSNFKQILSRLRFGHMSAEDILVLSERNVSSMNEIDEDANVLHICGNRRAHEINERMLMNLDGQTEHTFIAVKRWLYNDEDQTQQSTWNTVSLTEPHPQTMGEISQCLDEFCKRDHIKDVRRTTLRKGARVMINKNLYDYDDPKMKNGRIGTIVDIIVSSDPMEIACEYLLLCKTTRVCVLFDDDTANVVDMHPAVQMY